MERAMGKRSKERKGRIGWSKEGWVRRRTGKEKGVDGLKG